MPVQDIINKRKEIPVDHINRILSSTEAARFAAGYFFLSGLTGIAVISRESSSRIYRLYL